MAEPILLLALKLANIFQPLKSYGLDKEDRKKYSPEGSINAFHMHDLFPANQSSVTIEVF